jgi:hypothetical protein
VQAQRVGTERDRCLRHDRKAAILAIVLGRHKAAGTAAGVAAFFFSAPGFVPIGARGMALA